MHFICIQSYLLIIFMFISSIHCNLAHYKKSNSDDNHRLSSKLSNNNYYYRPYSKKYGHHLKNNLSNSLLESSLLSSTPLFSSNSYAFSSTLPPSSEDLSKSQLSLSIFLPLPSLLSSLASKWFSSPFYTDWKNDETDTDKDSSLNTGNYDIQNLETYNSDGENLLTHYNENGNDDTSVLHSQKPFMEYSYPSLQALPLDDLKREEVKKIEQDKLSEILLKMSQIVDENNGELVIRKEDEAKFREELKSLLQILDHLISLNNINKDNKKRSRNSRNRSTYLSDILQQIILLLANDKAYGTHKRDGPQLSVISPLDVLRDRLRLEMMRRKLQENKDQIETNAALLRSIGKRSIPIAYVLQKNTNSNDFNGKYDNNQKSKILWKLSPSPLPETIPTSSSFLSSTPSSTSTSSLSSPSSLSSSSSSLPSLLSLSSTRSSFIKSRESNNTSSSLSSTVSSSSYSSIPLLSSFSLSKLLPSKSSDKLTTASSIFSFSSLSSIPSRTLDSPLSEVIDHISLVKSKMIHPQISDTKGRNKKKINNE